MTREGRLERWLRAHRPTDPREARFVARMLALLASAGDPFSKDRFAPGHFTASGFVLSPDRGSLLMILHGRLGRWLQPGGHVDPDDADVLAAARREVREEVAVAGLRPADGHDGIFDVDIHPIPARDPYPAHEHFDVRFLFRAPTLTFRCGSDARDARWVPLDGMPGVERDPAMLRVRDKLLRLGSPQTSRA